MVKWGLIGAAVMLIMAIGGTLISPVCVPCIALLVGLAVGYLANRAEKPLENKVAAKKGALAGLLTGVGAFLGQMIGAVINGLLMTEEQLSAVYGYMESLFVEMGYDYSAIPAMGDIKSINWLMEMICGCGVSILDVAILAGLGALGGVLWWQMTGKDAVSPPPTDYSDPTAF